MKDIRLCKIFERISGLALLFLVYFHLHIDRTVLELFPKDLSNVWVGLCIIVAVGQVIFVLPRSRALFNLLSTTLWVLQFTYTITCYPSVVPLVVLSFFFMWLNMYYFGQLMGKIGDL